jgi:hypothetical protein
MAPIGIESGNIASFRVTLSTSFEIQPDKRISNSLPVSMPFIRRELFANSRDPYLRAQFGNLGQFWRISNLPIVNE